MKKLTLALLGTLAFAATSSASIVITFSARTVADTAGVPLVAGTLIQLIDLGPNGVFDPINAEDASNSGINRWVSGDDVLVDIPYKINATTVGDFPSAAAFDMVNGSDLTAGRISRQMLFGDGGLPSLVAGTKLGIRWFPGLQAANFGSTTLAIGQNYGQFTRQSPDALLHGGGYWVAPADGSTVAFDGYSTIAAPVDPAAAGFASFVVVPEPASIALSLIGAAGLAMLRRRRA